jgi:hypothetical protein
MPRPAKPHPIALKVQQAFAVYRKTSPGATLVNQSKVAERYFSFRIIDPTFQGVAPQERSQRLEKVFQAVKGRTVYFDVMSPQEAAILPLTDAADGGAVDEVRALLAAGADVNQPNHVGITALDCAVMGTEPDHTRTVEVLVAAGADVNAGEYTPPLMLASAHGPPDTVAALLQAGADVNRVTDSGTALHQAVAENRPDNVAVLLRAGARLDLTDEDGQTPIDLARRPRRPKILALLEPAAAAAPPVRKRPAVQPRRRGRG